MYSYVNVIVNSLIPALCLIYVMGYAAYFAEKQRVRAMFLGSFVFGLGALHQIGEIRTWYETGNVPSPDWILGDSVETAVYLLAVVLFLLFTFYYRRTQSLLEEKDLLLDEINHRVKNNLQVIQSLFSIYEKRVDQEDLTEILRDLRKKVESFALLHEQLHEQDDIRQVDSRKYLNNLCGKLEQTVPGKKDVDLETDIESHQLPVKKMIACGLIVSELVTNALNHAFPDENRGRVEVRFTGKEPYKLEVSDTGSGDFNGRSSNEGSGLGIVRSIVQLELQGDLRISEQEGITASVTFS